MAGNHQVRNNPAGDKKAPESRPRGAIIVAVLLPNENPDKLREELNELEALLRTLGIPVCDRLVQKRQRLTAKCLLGSGKVEEIRQLAEHHKVDLVVFDRPLSPPQIRNLEQMTGCEVLDRTGVILDIFSRHARTNVAKTQVEIAKLEYLLPRLSGAWTHFQRQTGGRVHSRGMGEKQIEIDRRRARERITRLREQLQQIQKEKATQRKARSNELKVALVGYTNSGKTTLMRALTRIQTSGRDELFATLDTNIKVIDPKTRPKILLSDTVGFIRNLPHSLIESFKSTLEEVKEADLLLHVVDASHPNYAEQMETTERVLWEIGADHIPQIKVFNKADQVTEQMLPRVLRGAYQGSIVVSAIKSEDAWRLREHIYTYFKENMITATFAIPIDDQMAQSVIFNNSLILNSDYSQQHKVYFQVQTTRSTVAKLQHFRVENMPVG